MKVKLFKVIWFLVKLFLPFLVVIIATPLQILVFKLRWTTAVTLAFLFVGITLIAKPLIVKIIEQIKSIEVVNKNRERSI
jgi:hypothetical protein